MEVVPVVVGPHQRELELGVAAAEEPLVQRPLEEGAFIPVPVEDEGIDAVRRRRIDFPAHHRRVGLVLITPERNLGLVVAGKARRGMLHQLPFGPALAVNGLVAGIGVIIREIVYQCFQGFHRNLASFACHDDFNRL
ncbi:hypothetical protein SDC9_142027 [bioreactor metagenome]|uniref:Uncharacterized protein n=1 Tax=bioreactor metagenome TaxID=1076179 RepID=A0A645E0I1_9ZZZZ